jgi:hypothetical protein
MLVVVVVSACVGRYRRVDAFSCVRAVARSIVRRRGAV